MIVRKGGNVERKDVGKTFGLPEGQQIIQWYFHSGTGDQKYHHKFAVRKYTLKPGKIDPKADRPFHYHKYVQAPFIISGRMQFETPEKSVEVGPGDEVIFAEDEPHRGQVLGGEPVELLCIIDCVEGLDCCNPESQADIIKFLK